MATTYKSSNSPLGIINVTTNESNTNQIGGYVINANNAQQLTSLFGSSNFTVYPSGTNPNGTPTGGAGITPDHTDDIYDTSIDSLVEYTSNPKMKGMKLKRIDFIYLKNYGVYPNNRLVVARRFSAGVGNDLTVPNLKPPMATLISWVPDDKPMLDGMTFGEKWEDVTKGSFTDILNDMGKDILGKGLGDKVAGGMDLIPLSGLTEGVQINILKELGLVAPENTILPSGNPNLIKEAKRRKTVGKDEAGSGLDYAFEYKMKVEYRQQYVNGIDNDLVYYDFLANILSFATSDSQFMYNSAFAAGSTDLMKNLISGDITAVITSIKDFITKFIAIISAKAQQIASTIGNVLKETVSNPDKAKADALNALSAGLALTVGTVIGKYKMAILGVINALTGSPSTPWHLTIGNPKKPFFCSGDMLVSGSTITYGPTLAFNDKPTEITVEFTLKNARACGAQEIFNKFNSGIARSYSRIGNDIAASNDNTPDSLLYDKSKTDAKTAFDAAQVSNSKVPKIY